MYKLGIDVGGTNTDAVLIDESMNVVAAVKQHTTKDVYGGIMNAVDAVLEESGVDAALINQAMLAPRSAQMRLSSVRACPQSPSCVLAHLPPRAFLRWWIGRIPFGLCASTG